MASITNVIEKILSNKHVKYGLPFFLLMTAGWLGVREFASIKYEFRKNEMLDPYDLTAEGVKTKKRGEVTLESEYEKIKKIDIDNWENIRGPRLWDETPQA